MNEKVKELLLKYINAKLSVIGEFSRDMNSDRINLIEEVKNYCQDFNIQFEESFIPSYIWDMLECDKNLR